MSIYYDAYYGDSTTKMKSGVDIILSKLSKLELHEKGYLTSIRRHNDKNRTDLPKEDCDKDYTRKVIHEDISKYQTHNDSIFYPIYYPAEMNIMDKWIFNWLKDQRFCQIPSREAPYADDVYHDFLQFSQRDKRDYRLQEFFGHFYLRFPCCKPVGKRLRRRRGKSVLDIPTHQQCVECFEHYAKKYLHKRLM